MWYRYSCFYLFTNSSIVDQFKGFVCFKNTGFFSFFHCYLHAMRVQRAVMSLSRYCRVSYVVNKHILYIIIIYMHVCFSIGMSLCLTDVTAVLSHISPSTLAYQSVFQRMPSALDKSYYYLVW
jgi:hypothetical protein